MTVQELLTEQGLTTALIVDDAYDHIPRAEDIANDDEAWSTFIADVGTDRDAVVAAFPAYNTMHTNDLRHSDEFVAALWGARSKLRPELWNTLFDTYERSTEGDRRFLKELEARLESHGVKPVTSGRTIPTGADGIGLIFADLFLGAAQQPEDIDRSIQRLQNLLGGRELDPPTCDPNVSE